MEFRLATLEDLPQIKAVYTEIIEDMREKRMEIWDDVYPCACFEEDIGRGRMHVLVDNGIIAAGFVLNDGHPGSASIGWTMADGKALYLDRLGVNVKYVRKGMGSAALKRAEQIARVLGAQSVRLFVVDFNVPAIRLYEKNGYARAAGMYDNVVDETLVLPEYGYEKRV